MTINRKNLRNIETMGFGNKRGIDAAFDYLSDAQRKQAFDVLKSNNISIYYRENNKNIDAREYLKQKYGADL